LFASSYEDGFQEKYFDMKPSRLHKNDKYISNIYRRLYLDNGATTG
jgi:hypothetical protein